MKAIGIGIEVALEHVVGNVCQRKAASVARAMEQHTEGRCLLLIAFNPKDHAIRSPKGNATKAV